MSNTNVFQNSAKALPKRDAQIIRVPMDELEIGGRKGHLPSENMSGNMAITHVPNAGGKQ
jgi:hypothetical protein